MSAKYDLGTLARKSGQRRLKITLPAIASRNADRETLRRIIISVVDGGAEERRHLLSLANRAQSALTTDDIGLDGGMRDFRSSQQTRLGRAVGAIRGWVRKVAAWFDQRWVQSVKTALGVDISALVDAGDVQGVIALVTQKLVAQVKSIADDVAARIETGLIELITRGASAKEKAAALVGTIAKARQEANRAAIRETETLHSVMNQFRQQQAGVTQYEWWTRQDERVRGNPQGRYPRSRPSHFARHGGIYRWDRPPNDGKYDGHPGEPPNCRCVARPVVTVAPAKPALDPNRARLAGLRAVAGEFGLSL